MSNIEEKLAQGAKSATEMRENFNQEPESLPPFLQEFLNKIFAFEISNLEREMGEFSPAIVNLFEAISQKIATAQGVLVEKLTSSANLAEFTKGAGENGIAENMPPHLVPLVISALAKLAWIDQKAEVGYQDFVDEFSALLVKFYQEIKRASALAQDAAIKKLEEEKVILEAARAEVTFSVASLEHTPTKQATITQKTKWLSARIKKIGDEISQKKQSLNEFMRNTKELFMGGAKLVSQPLAA